MSVAVARRADTTRGTKSRYTPPGSVRQVTFEHLLSDLGLPSLQSNQLSLIAGGHKLTPDFPVWLAGDLDVLRQTAVSVVGAREVSEEAAARARKMGRLLAEAGVTVVSGLAHGVDTHALTAAINAGGRVAAVIGTPINQAYPAANAGLHETIYRRHLLISQFAEGSRVFKTNFPARNRLMASLTLGTVIVEASDSSGTLHQAVECTRLKRWLFVLKSVVDDPFLKWPAQFRATYDRFVVVESVEDILERVRPGCS